MSTTKYILAKYIPHMQRFEPRNIGVVVWSAKGVAARFIGERPERLGEVDGRSVPAFVTSPSAYKQWVQYWREMLRYETFTAPESGKLVALSSPEFMQAVLETGRGNFVLAEPGEIWNVEEGEDVSVLADRLFADLVESTVQEEVNDPSLDTLVNEALQRHGIIQHQNYRRDYPVRCRVHGVDEEYIFSDALANGSPIKLYQRMQLPKYKAPLRKTVHDVAWSFDHVIEEGIIQQEATAVLVSASEEDLSRPEVYNGIQLLRSVTNVINLKDDDQSNQALAEVAAEPVH